MTESPCGSSQFLLVFGLLSSSSGCVSSERSRLLLGFRPCLCLLGFFSLTLTFLSSSETCLRVLYLFSTLPWLHTIPCWVTSLASAFLCFPLISSFLFFFGSVVSSVFSLSLVSLLGVSCGFLPSLGFYLSSLSSCSLRFSHTWVLFWWDLPLLTGWVCSRQCPARFLFPVWLLSLSYLLVRVQMAIASFPLPRSFWVRSFRPLWGFFPLRSSSALCILSGILV